MLEQLRKARQEESGFTLIELLIVIVILGVLAGIVVFAIGGINDRGNEAACKADSKTIEVAQEAYYAKNTAYAGSVAILKGANFLKDDSTMHTTNTSGVVSPVAPCTI